MTGISAVWDRQRLPPECMSSIGAPAELTPPWGNIAAVFESLTGSLSLALWQELADFLRSGILTSGIRTGETRPQFNGMDDVAVRCVCFLKRSKDGGRTPAYEHAPGNVYIIPAKVVTPQGEGDHKTEEFATVR